MVVVVSTDVVGQRGRDADARFSLLKDRGAVQGEGGVVAEVVDDRPRRVAVANVWPVTGLVGDERMVSIVCGEEEGEVLSTCGGGGSSSSGGGGSGGGGAARSFPPLHVLVPLRPRDPNR